MAEVVGAGCPICGVGLEPPRSSTCSRCGLWWVRGDTQQRSNVPEAAGALASEELRLVLVERWSLGSVTCLAALSLFGAALAAGLWSLRHGVPRGSGSSSACRSGC